MHIQPTVPVIVPTFVTLHCMIPVCMSNESVCWRGLLGDMYHCPQHICTSIA
jgi:hypothetical protein